jgi:hypothetical protein
MKVKNGAQYAIEKLKQLQTNENSMGGLLKVKKEELNKNINTAKFSALQNEFKSLNGAYVDVVHMMAELDERYKSDMKLLNTFEEEYRADFYEIFEVESLLYKKQILEILNTQAYIFDKQLWNEAKQSKAIKAHFSKSSISGDLTTKTYLKYYLDTLDSCKASEENKKLFELYEELKNQQKDYIIVVMSSASDAMEHETFIKKLDKSLNVKSFIDERTALKFAMNNCIRILVIEDRLQKTSAERFLHVYQKNIFLAPDIILLGQKPKLSPLTISKLLSKNASPRQVKDNIKMLIENGSLN